MTTLYHHRVTNARADLERCLESLHAAPPVAPHEILVVDNASTDGSADAVRRRMDVTLIEAGANLGFARANNIGIRASRGTNILLLNSDTSVPPGAIDGRSPSSIVIQMLRGRLAAVGTGARTPSCPSAA